MKNKNADLRNRPKKDIVKKAMQNLIFFLSEVERVIDEEEKIITEAIGAIAAAKKVIDDAERVVAEEKRVIEVEDIATDEAGRVIAEFDRAIAEVGRVIYKDEKAIAAAEIAIAEAERVVAETKKVTVESVWKPLKSFLTNFLKIVIGKEANTNIELIYHLDDGNQTGLSIIKMGEITLTFDINDLYRYYGLIKLLKGSSSSPTTVDFPFQFVGEERIVTSKILPGDAEGIDYDRSYYPWDGRIVLGKNFSRDAEIAIKKGRKFSSAKGYELETCSEMKFLVSSNISERNPITYLFLLPPVLQKFNEINTKDEDGYLLHGAEYKIPDINIINWRTSYEQEKSGKYYRLNEVFRTLIVYYGIAFVNYDAITMCHVCGKILMPITKSKRSFCPKGCRNRNHRHTFGKNPDELMLGTDEYRCWRRHKRFFTDSLNQDASIDPEICKKCDEYKKLELSISGTCKEFISKYGKQDIEDKKRRLQTKIIALQKEYENEERQMFHKYIDSMVELQEKKKKD